MKIFAICSVADIDFWKQCFLFSEYIALKFIAIEYLHQNNDQKTTRVLLIPMVFRFMISQRISCFENVSTKSTGNRDPSNMMSLNVLHYTVHTSLLSTHLTYSCSSVPLRVKIGILTECHHWLHLLVQTFHISVVGCLVCTDKYLFICCLYNTTIFIEPIFIYKRFFCHRAAFGRFWLGFCFVGLGKTSASDSVWFPLRPFSWSSSARTRKESRFSW